MPLVRSRSRPARSFGSFARALLGFFAAGLLVAAAAFLWIRFREPAPLAQLAPADSFLAFELDPASPDWPQLAAFFAGLDFAQLFELDSIGLADSAELQNLIAGRAGLVFLGSQFDPARFVFIGRVEDTSAAEAWLASQLLPGDAFQIEKYRGYEIRRPGRGGLSFAWRGADLLAAPNPKSIQLALDSADGAIANLKSSAGYAGAIRGASPRAAGFVYFSPAALRAATQNLIPGSPAAAGAAAADLFAGAGFAISAQPSSLQFTGLAPLPESAQRLELFSPRGSVGRDLLAILPAGSRIFAANELAETWNQFSARAPADSALPVLAGNSLLNWLTQFTGSAESAQDFAARIGAEDFAFARTPAGWLLAARGNFQADFAGFAAGLARQPSLLNSVPAAIRLPDNSAGTELQANPAAVRIENLQLETLPAQRILRPDGSQLIFVQLRELALLGSDPAALAAAIRSAADSASPALIFPDSQIVFASPIDSASAATPAWLRPFGFAALGLGGDPTGLSLNLQLLR